MSLYCPKCGGLVYARSNSKCGHCGADLPADFRFTEAELASEAERIRGLSQPQMPTISLFAIFCGIICVAACIYDGVTRHDKHYWVNWVLAALGLAVVFERLVRYFRQKKQYEKQKHAVQPFPEAIRRRLK